MKLVQLETANLISGCGVDSLTSPHIYRPFSEIEVASHRRYPFAVGILLTQLYCTCLDPEHNMGADGFSTFTNSSPKSPSFAEPVEKKGNTLISNSPKP